MVAAAVTSDGRSALPKIAFVPVERRRSMYMAKLWFAVYCPHNLAVLPSMLSDSRFTNRARFGALLVGLALPCIACAVIVGWMTHTPALVQVLPAAPAMRFNTATSFFWLGIALVFLVSHRLWLPRCLGAAIAIFAALTLSQDLFAIDLGIDNLLFVDWGGIGPNASGRMATITSICFILSGMCVVSLSFVPGRRFQPLFECLFGSIVFANGAVSAFGYLLGLESSYGWGGSLGMAIHTATSFTFVGLAIIGLALVHERCWSSSIPTWLPLPVSLCAATAALALCQALYLDESKQTSQTTLARGKTRHANLDALDVANSKHGTNGPSLGNGRPTLAKVLGGRRRAVDEALH